MLLLCFVLYEDLVVGELVKDKNEVFLGPLAKYHHTTIPLLFLVIVS